MNDFTVIEQPYGSHWLHADGRHFISHHGAVHGMVIEHYQAYTSKAKPPKGRYPWTVDNRRIGPDARGFPTLEAAMRACVEDVTA